MLANSWQAVLLGLLMMGAGSAASTPERSGREKLHHTAAGFRNNYAAGKRANFWKWRWERFWHGLPREPEGGYAPEVLKPDTSKLRSPDTNPSVTWLGHSTLLVRLGGLNILTDPHFSERASPISFLGPKRRIPPPLALRELPHIDAVLISHNHYDHLDLETVEQLAAQPGGPPKFFVPLRLRSWFLDQGVENVVEQDWWDRAPFHGLTVHFVPVQHWSARTLTDENQTLWGGFVVEYDGFTFFFAGDTGYSPDFKDIRERLGSVDFAAIPIGGYDPRWFMKVMHVNPEEAVQIHQDLEARYSVGIHWGTFELTDETIDEPPRRLRGALQHAGIDPERFFVMKHGETRSLRPLMKAPASRGPQQERRLVIGGGSTSNPG